MHNILLFIHENLILSIIWCLLLIILTSIVIQNIFSKFTMINHDQAIKLIDKENAIIIDTRFLESDNKNYTMEVIHLPLKKILLGQVQELFIHQKRPFILIFSDFQGSDQYSEKLYEYGFHRLYILDDGIQFLNKKNLPLILKDK